MKIYEVFLISGQSFLVKTDVDLIADFYDGSASIYSLSDILCIRFTKVAAIIVKENDE